MMFSIPAFANGFFLTASLIVAVGAQNTFVLRQGLRREHIGAIVAFCSTAHLILVATGVAGLGTVLQHVPSLAFFLTLGGAAFLLWYVVGALRRVVKPESLVADRGPGRLTLAAILGRTAAFTFLNPHVYLDTLLVMGAVGAAQPVGGQMVFVIGAWLAAAIWFSAVGYGARALAPLFARPIAWRFLDGFVAAVMLNLAWKLLAGLIAGT
jgi:L-lysine exporter family protein LysE/ArgO